MIRINGAKKKYQIGKRELWALGGVSLSIDKGDFIALKGPSGSGKSTLLNILGMLDSMTEGEYLLDGESVGGMDAKRRSAYRKKYLGFIFQGYNLIPELSVYQNVEVPLLISRKKKSEYRDDILRIIEDVGLKDHIAHRPGELSGGQQQRVAIARALVRKPPLVIADEPTANLDSKTGMGIMELMRGLNEKYGVTFVFATHDANIAPYMKRIHSMLDGMIVDEIAEGRKPAREER
jgi:putative ABC transport system ATP-binding protein